MEDVVDSSTPGSLNGLSDANRGQAQERFQAIRPFLEEGFALREVALTARISLRTARYWVERYRKDGLAGLARKPRSDKNQSRLSEALCQVIEGMALQKPRASAATVHRKAIAVAKQLGERPPSYSLVYGLIRRIDPALLTMAHEGSKAYSDNFDLIYRREAEAPNVIWQADHTELDILVRDHNGNGRKPWLTIILDDYSRAIAGYFLSVSSPSAIQTALALRQAIWRKTQPGWNICGIPQILYTDHGSDFTSQHIEQVLADLKVQLIFSTVGKPRGRGKVERFFRSFAQVFLSRVPGYSRSVSGRIPEFSLSELSEAFEKYLINEYLVTPHSATGASPQARWEEGGFLPNLPGSLECLDLLLLTVAKSRRVHPDGIHFSGMRYMDSNLAAYVGESVVVRYDPRDMAEIRVFYKDRFVSRAVCQELAGQTVTLREIVNARDRQRRELQQTLQDRRNAVDSLLEARRWTATKADSPPSAPSPSPRPPRLKRYFNE
jgi:putative transposase